MTIRVLEKRILELPPRSRVRLAERIIESIDDYSDPGLQAAWEDETERQVMEIQSCADKGIPADQVMKKARQESRRIRNSAGPAGLEPAVGE
jgi:putative addiction module component (TIGR02574 family)